MTLRLETRPSPIGDLLIVTHESGGLAALDFADYEPRMLRLLARHHGAAALVSGPAPAAVSQALDAYFDGDIRALEGLTTATGGTDFQRRVWQALRAITAGATESYGALAARLGQPGASRAVGMANGVNPVAIVVPCHRVIGAKGALVGYSGGMARKTWLLDHERRNLARAA